MTNFISALKPLKDKVIINRLIRGILIGLIVGVCADVAIVLLSKFMYIEFLFKAGVAIPAFCVALAEVIGIINKPSDREIAIIADSLGFEERFITAYEILRDKNNSEIAKLAVEDCLKCAKNTDIKALYKIEMPTKWFKILFGCVLLLGVCTLLPSPVAEKIEGQREFREDIKREIQEIKRLSTDNSITKNQQKEIVEQVDELEKGLKKAKNRAEAVRELQKTQRNIKDIEKNNVNNDLKELSEGLVKNESTQELGEMLASGNVEKIKEGINDAIEKIDNMSDEEIEEYAKNLAEISDNLSKDNELRQALDDTVEAMNNSLETGDKKEIGEKLNELQDKVEELAEENESLNAAVQRLNQQLSRSANKMGASSGESQQKAENTEGTTGNATGGANTEGSENGEGTGNGGGSGAGNGSVESQNIYSRRAEEYGEYAAEIGGGENTGGENNDKTVTGYGEKGEIKGYKSVYEQYKKEALNSIEDEDVPYGVKEIVKDYFTKLD